MELLPWIGETSLDEFWSSMQEFLAAPKRAILLSLGDHWSVVSVTEVSDKRVTFFDSDGIKGHGRKAVHSPPPHRSVRALLTHTAPTSGIWREIAFLDMHEQLAPWAMSA